MPLDDEGRRRRLVEAIFSAQAADHGLPISDEQRADIESFAAGELTFRELTLRESIRFGALLRADDRD